MKINILMTVGSPLRSVSSGINSYAIFRALLRKPVFPATEDNALMWGSTFKPGRTYRNYLAHLRKACLLIDSSLEWHTPRVRKVARGLKQGRRIAFQFPNFLYTQDLFTIINKLGWGSRFAQLSFISFLFPLRIPSEALFLRRAFSGDRINEFSPQNDKVLVGVREFKGCGCLIIKMTWRKNLEGECLLRRPCLCEESLGGGRRLCPPHAFLATRGVAGRTGGTSLPRIH